MHKHPTVTVLRRLYLFAILILICGSAHAVEPQRVGKFSAINVGELTLASFYVSTSLMAWPKTGAE